MMLRKGQAPTSGYDEQVSIRDGHLPRPPATSLLDLSFDAVSPGRVVLGFRPTRRFADGDTIPGGVLAGVADCAMTTAVRTTVLATTGVVTTSLSIEHLHPVAVDSGPLRAEAWVVEGTRAQAVVTDGAGRVVLRAEAVCRALPVSLDGSVPQPRVHQAA